MVEIVVLVIGWGLTWDGEYYKGGRSTVTSRNESMPLLRSIDGG